MTLPPVFRLYISFLQYQLKSLYSGRGYEHWLQSYYTLCTTPLRKKALAKEIEQALPSRHGILSYAEFLDFDQFGAHGYHADHRLFGSTRTFEHWPEALVALCRESNLTQIVEFGSGNGLLGVLTAQAASKQGFSLRWSGVERNQKLQYETQRLFRKYHQQASLAQIVGTIDELHIAEPVLLVFSYSFDSIPPELFVNTKEKAHYPADMIGVFVKDGVAHETFLSDGQRQKKRIGFQEGIYQDQYGRSFDLTSWKLSPMQRAYIPMHAFSITAELISRVPKGSRVLLLDECSPMPFPSEKQHLCMPKDLYSYERFYQTPSHIYQRAGQHLLYYVTYFETLRSFLHQAGFAQVQGDIEQRVMQKILGQEWEGESMIYFTTALLTSAKIAQTQKRIRIQYPSLEPNL